MSHLAQAVPIAHARAPVVLRLETLLQRFLRGGWMDVFAVKNSGDVVWLRAL